MKGAPIILVIGGFVRSEDGDVHRISAHKVLELHELDKKSCVIITDSNYPMYEREINSGTTLIAHARSNGKYDMYGASLREELAEKQKQWDEWKKANVK